MKGVTKDAETGSLVHINVKWCSCFGNSLAVPQKLKQSYHMTQQFVSWVYTQEN